MIFFFLWCFHIFMTLYKKNKVSWHFVELSGIFHVAFHLRSLQLWFMSASLSTTHWLSHASNGGTRTNSKWYLIQLATCGGDGGDGENEERGDSALNQAWTCCLWSCPDIKPLWNLTHTSYIDLHSLVILFEAVFAQVCVKFKCKGVVCLESDFEAHVVILRKMSSITTIAARAQDTQISRFLICFHKKLKFAFALTTSLTFWDSCHEELSRLPQATFCCLLPYAVYSQNIEIRAQKVQFPQGIQSKLNSF